MDPFRKFNYTPPLRKKLGTDDAQIEAEFAKIDDEADFAALDGDLTAEQQNLNKEHEMHLLTTTKPTIKKKTVKETIMTIKFDEIKKYGDYQVDYTLQKKNADESIQQIYFSAQDVMSDDYEVAFHEKGEWQCWDIAIRRKIPAKERDLHTRDNYATTKFYTDTNGTVLDAFEDFVKKLRKHTKPNISFSIENNQAKLYFKEVIAKHLTLLDYSNIETVYSDDTMKFPQTVFDIEVEAGCKIYVLKS